MKTAIELADDLRDLVDLHPHAYDVCEQAAAMLLQQAEQIEALTKERDGAYVQSLQFSAENEALKADADLFVSMSEYLISDSTDHDDKILAAKTVNEMRVAIDSAKETS